MAKTNSTWGERLAAACAVLSLVGTLALAMSSCGGADLIFSGEFPTETPRVTTTPSLTPTPGGDATTASTSRALA